MFKIFLGIAPWIIFFLLNGEGKGGHLLAIWAALGSTICFSWGELRKGFVLSWATLLFFVVLLGFFYLAPESFLIQQANFFSGFALALIAFGSLVFKMPFTLQYAREQVPQQFWSLPSFLRINQVITSVWGVTFLINGAASFFHEKLLGLLFAYLPFVIAIVFTKQFPSWYLGRKEQRAIEVAEKESRQSPFLKGNFAPVHQEIFREQLSVEGEIPRDLCGVYMRNGPNPLFPPFSYTYPFDGDGMIHAIYLREGRASYRNRFVETDQLLAERRVGKAIYGGVECPFLRDGKRLHPTEPQIPVKLGRFIHVIRHANRYIALHESTSAYEITRELATIGEWNPTQAQEAISVNPHSRLDPQTGELFLLSYHVNRPGLSFYVLNKEGRRVEAGEIPLPDAYMVHDFVLTKNYFVIVICPVIVDFLGRARGKHFFNWQPELPTKIALLDRKALSGPIRWFETDPFFTYHFSNAFEEGANLFIDYVRYSHFTMTTAQLGAGHLYRTTLNLNRNSCHHQQLAAHPVEFPRIHEGYIANPYRYIYTATTLHGTDLTIANGLFKQDLKTNKSTLYDFGPTYEIGEATFVPRQGAVAEDDGYLLLFGFDRATERSFFFILDATNLSSPPLARISLPQRVPHGLHGSWFPEEGEFG